MKKIKLNGTSNSILNIGLMDIINEVELSNKVYWKILWIDGFGKVEATPMQKLENDINKSSGVFVDSSFLQKLTPPNVQLTNLLLIGGDTEEGIKSYNLENYKNGSLKAPKYIVELCDSSFWEFASSDSKLLKDIERLNGLAN
ncbi:hypothetical protein [Ulvibacterium marinum]|uniref:Uncharacterized protein n=1 Tax=Ulvibacterium marinum TaxID=2419782 RepID=A0A3B0BUM3_9FLAO|nr:hypothetical protein [Ulvibacterium marinum]RKN75919.1 hypothetical protein D7Z94_24980 [Ulvibacterium marinum]